MRKITIFDNNDFELILKNNNIYVDANKEWKIFINENNIDIDSLLDYDQFNALILKLIGNDLDDIDKINNMINEYESNHPEMYEN